MFSNVRVKRYLGIVCTKLYQLEEVTLKDVKDVLNETKFKINFYQDTENEYIKFLEEVNGEFNQKWLNTQWKLNKSLLSQRKIKRISKSYSRKILEIINQRKIVSGEQIPLKYDICLKDMYELAEYLKEDLKALEFCLLY